MGWLLLLHRHGAGRGGGHGAALPFRTGPGLGVTLAVSALQKEILWPWGGLTPPPPSWSHEKTPWNAGAAPESRLRGDGPVAAEHWGRAGSRASVGMRAEDLIHCREPLPSRRLADSPRTEGAGGGSGKTQRDASAVALEKGETCSVGTAAVGLPL